MSSLTKFLFSLTTDAAVRTEFQKDPESTMNKAGLSNEYKEIIMSKDNDKISKAVADENHIENAAKPAWTIGIFITIKF
jgi:hypothetical protein